jgi:thymidylate synthase (FAD)
MIHNMISQEDCIVKPMRDPYGDDNMVVDAARVSFAKVSSHYTPEQNAKLVGYLAKHNHWSPFAHPHASFRITAPIFVARQLVKHQIGLSWNEESRRYIDGSPIFYTTKEWRLRPEGSIKQGSGEVIDAETSLIASQILTNLLQISGDSYTSLLNLGIAPEQARMVLPLCTMTSWVWTGSLYAWARVCNLRLDPHAQVETRDVAAQIAVHMRKWFPLSWSALSKYPAKKEEVNVAA